MARKCDVCGRGPKKSQTSSHSNVKTIRRQYLNLQKREVEGERKNVCNKCLRTLRKKMAEA